MLVEFSVENFRSIREEQRISFLATSDKEHWDTHVSHSPAPGVERLLKSAVIYGANAAGKSNLLLALDLMSDIVGESASDEKGKVLTRVEPYCFGAYARKPTKLEAVFITGGVKYQYGFVVDSTRVIEEWLYAFPEKRSQEWFYRKKETADSAPEWKLGQSLKGQRTLWRDSTRENALFLSTAVQLNAEQLRPVAQFFRAQLRVVLSGELRDTFSTSKLSDPQFKERLTKFLAAADTGVSGLATRKKAPDPDDLQILEFLQGEAREQFQREASVEVAVQHRGLNGEEVWLGLGQESRGTRKLFSFAGPVLDTLENGFTLVVDELNNSLHPLIVRKIVEAFHDSSVNTGGAQLIFATHASSMLDLHLFRRDQIWFVEKDTLGSTNIYPLTDFCPRKDISLEKGYLLGKFGAVPFLSQGLL